MHTKMGKYLQAKEVVKDSSDVERNGTKIGTLRRKTDSISLRKQQSYRNCIR